MPPSKLTYVSYLKIEELLSLQRPQSNPPVPDETFFIIVHQAYELWFKQILTDLSTVFDNLEQNKLTKAIRLLGRIDKIFRVLISQVDVLETMTPVEYSKFRGSLGTASGFQSIQFRLLELTAGSDPKEYEGITTEEPEWKAVLNSVGNRNLRYAVRKFLEKRAGLKGEGAEPLISTFAKVYQDNTDTELVLFCEKLTTFDETLCHWRFRHAQMVERIIGMNKGTGGSPGVAYLQSTIKKRYFPELWEARTRMGGYK